VAKKTIDRLTWKRVLAAKLPPGESKMLLNDGPGIYLEIAQGTEGLLKSWHIKYPRVDGARDSKGRRKMRQMRIGSIGLYGDDLEAMRKVARGNLQMAAQGIDPIDARDQRQMTDRAKSLKRRTFKECAEGCYADHHRKWSKVHAAQWINTLRDYAFPAFGDFSLPLIERAHILEAFKPIWQTRYTTAARTLDRVAMVFEWAREHGYFDGVNPATWKTNFRTSLPRGSKRGEQKHLAALHYSNVPGLVAKLPTALNAATELRALIMLGVRLGEFRYMRRDEVDLERGIWIIPAAKTKAGREHRVPLAPEVLAILKAQPVLMSSPYFFPSARAPRKPTSGMGMRHLMQRLAPGVTLHGFRASFRSWVKDCTNYPREIAEAALGHVVGDLAEQAYARSDALERRRQMMNSWARYCNAPAPPKGEVIPLRGEG
jgi:integrase